MKIIRKLLHTNFLVFGIVILALVLRFYALDKIPASLNPDETSLGYTAFSLLKTGADEHGKFFPQALESFGDWKLPVYSFVSMASVYVFGLNAFSTRLVSALAGVFAVILIYLISKKLFKDNKIALISSLFLSIAPWSIYFSRAAYEVNLATTFFLGGLLFFLKYVDKGKNKTIWLTLASAFIALTVFTYNSYIIFIPLFTASLVYLYREKITLNFRLIVPFLVLSIAIVVSIYSSIFTSTYKTSTLLVFNDANTIYNRVEKIRGDGASNSPLEKIIYNKFTGGLYQFGQNYLSAFSPGFLFDKGGEKLVDNLGYFGNLYLVEVLFIIAGIAAFIAKREKATKLLFLWLVLAPIPTALTKNPLSSTRLFLLMPILIIISAYGFYQIMIFLQKRNLRNYLLKLLILTLFIYNIFLFMDAYFVHLNSQRARFWDYGYQQIVELTRRFPNYKVVMRGPENFPYIYFLFYNQYSPTKFISDVKYYLPTNEGFLYVKSFDRFSFVTSLDQINMQHNTIYIDDNYLRFKDKILLPSGEPVLSYEVVK